MIAGSLQIQSLSNTIEEKSEKNQDIKKHNQKKTGKKRIYERHQKKTSSKKKTERKRIHAKQQQQQNNQDIFFRRGPYMGNQKAAPRHEKPEGGASI